MTSISNFPRRPLALRRSWLFTSGLDERAQQAALDSAADVLVADLEEFTAAADRPIARPRVAALMQRCRAQGMLGAVRINRLVADGLSDLQAVMAGAPDAVFLPQVQSADEIIALAAALDEQEVAYGLPAGSTEIVPTIESALGIVRLQAILGASHRISACLLAAEDLTADLGAERGPDSLELNHLRSRFHIECRAAGCLSIDCPFNYLDSVAQVADLAWARRVGMTAKCTVFAAQVAAIHAALTPSDDQVRGARDAVARFEAAKKSNGDRDQAVQVPDYHTARRLLARADAFNTWAAQSRRPSP